MSEQEKIQIERDFANKILAASRLLEFMDVKHDHYDQSIKEDLALQVVLLRAEKEEKR